jgi:L-alanine-DL-glutamate epimerase-like enolase superfamily enzyme
MRISDVTVDVVEVPFREPVVTALRRWTVRRVALVRLRAHRGVGGEREPGDDSSGRLHAVAEAAPSVPDAMPTGAGPILADGLTRTLAGLDPSDDDAVDARLAVIDAWPEVGRAVRSAVDTAIVGLLAAHADRSIAAWLSPRPLETVAVNGLLAARDPDGAARHAAALAEAGYACLKLKGGDEPLDATIARVAAVRDAVGPGVELRLDVNGAWDLATAARALGELAPFELEYVEQPFPVGTPPDAVAGLRWAADVPIAADESVTDPGTARFLIANGAVDAMVVKPARVGGLRASWRIAEVAAAAGVPVVVSTLFETGVGIRAGLELAAALPGEQRAHGLATGGLLESTLVDDRLLEVRDGRMRVPLRPPHGADGALDRDAVERYRVS